jgi:hypothetical protein
VGSGQWAKKKKGKGEEIKITNYKSQITNKSQIQNYKLQTLLWKRDTGYR